VAAVRVAELIGLREFRVRDGEIADPGPGQVQVEVQAVGICGSDLHAYSEGGIGEVACVYPQVLGHEPAGVIAKLGPGVSGWARGDAASFEPAHYCYHCELCLKGRHNLCARIRFLSTPGEPGFFRERVNLPVENLLPQPAHVPIAMATMVEPLAVALHSLSLARPALGETAVVFGAGPIGLLTVASLKRAGIGRIFSVEPVAHRRELARLMGADAQIGASPADAARTILSDTSQRGVDMVFDCAAAAQTADASLQVAASGGRVVFTGIPSERRVSHDVHLWRRKELAVFQVRRSNHQGGAARDLIARELRFFAPVVTHQRPLESIGEAFRLVAGYEDGVGKLVIRPDAS
jgi:L-iditol 2-dehydrogenase